MARVTLTAQRKATNSPLDGVLLTETAADTTNKEQVLWTGKEIIVAHNTGGSAYTVTITSAADKNGRTLDITADSLAAGVIAFYGPFPADGWRQSTGMLFFEASNVAVKFGVIGL